MRNSIIRRGRRAVGVAVAGAAMALCLPSSPASAAMVWTFHNGYSGKCLEVADWRTDNGAPARQWDCTGQPNQGWYWIDWNSNDDAMLQNQHSGKCLEVADWRTDNGAPVRQWDCTGRPNQEWAFVLSGSRNALINRHSGKCLEVADWRTDNGAPVRQWDCTGQPNQQW